MQVLTVDFQDPTSPAKFTESLLNTGFGIIKNHNIDNNKINEAYAKWEAFFLAPDAEKEPFLFDMKTHEGYVPFHLSETAKGNDVKDIKEFYHFYPWSRCPEQLRPLTMSLYEDLTNLAKTLLQWIEDNTPDEVAKYFSMPLMKMIENSNRTLFRILYYPALKGDEDPKAIRAAAHEDINLITILPAATAEGLQVQTTDGNWLDVPCDPNTIIINIADMLHECSNGYYKATTHRVINPKGEKAKLARLSMPLFLHPADNIKLSERHTSDSYRFERYQELGLVE